MALADSIDITAAILFALVIVTILNRVEGYALLRLRLTFGPAGFCRVLTI